MYQIRVRWSHDKDYKNYEFLTKAEALAFQKALKELILNANPSVTYEFAKQHPHYLFTILATVLVSAWAVFWWHLGAKLFPNAAMNYTDAQIAICSALAYLTAKLVSRWFDA